MNSDRAKQPESRLYFELAERHGHYCPMSTLGLRIGWAARIRLEAEIVEAVYQMRTCAADGIKLALQLPALRVEEGGAHCLQLCDGRQRWRIELRQETLRLAASYRGLPGDAEREALLERLRTADESELLEIRRLEMRV